MKKIKVWAILTNGQLDKGLYPVYPIYETYKDAKKHNLDVNHKQIIEVDIIPSATSSEE